MSAVPETCLGCQQLFEEANVNVGYVVVDFKEGEVRPVAGFFDASFVRGHARNGSRYWHKACYEKQR